LTSARRRLPRERSISRVLKNSENREFSLDRPKRANLPPFCVFLFIPWTTQRVPITQLQNLPRSPYPRPWMLGALSHDDTHSHSTLRSPGQVLARANHRLYSRNSRQEPNWEAEVSNMIVGEYSTFTTQEWFVGVRTQLPIRGRG
jgi:hypothetical protein